MRRLNMETILQFKIWIIIMKVMEKCSDTRKC